MWRKSTGVGLMLSVLGMAAFVPAGVAAPPALDLACAPAPANCNGWYRSAVELRWEWNNLVASPTNGNCNARTFAADTPGTRVFCEVGDLMTGDLTRRNVTIHIDRAPPEVAAAPARAPDYGGWFNHPVSVPFAGVDATSGVASCSSSGWGGPDGAGIVLSGTCTDVAGNVGSASFALNYDATAPAAPEVTAVPGHRHMTLSWEAPADAQTVVVSRVTGDGSPDLLFTGTAEGFTHRRLKNGTRYRYLVTALDQAGNRAVDRASGVPTGLPLLSPARGAHLENPPLLLWEPVKRASYYNVQLYRGRKKVLTRWPQAETLQLAERWRYGGERYALKPGPYTWFVFPGFGERSARRYGELLGKSTFRVTR